MSATRDAVNNLASAAFVTVSGDTNHGSLLYTNTPAFEIVKSSLNVAGFSATSHYRISQLAKELDDEIVNVAASLASETEARISGDASVQTLLDAESEARSNAVSTEVSTRTSAYTVLSTAISTEVVNRSEAVATYSTALSTEASTRTSADTSLTTRISAEEITRANAVTAESNARITADNSLSTLISTEVVDRSNAVSTELSTRVSADLVLSEAISTEVVDRTSAVSSLQTSLEGVASELSNAIVTETDDRSNAVSAESAARSTAVSDLEVQFGDISSDLDTYNTQLNDRLDNIISNTDPAAIDSLSEILAAYQGADGSLVQTLNGIVSVTNQNNQSHDERLDYLEKFCTMVSSFLHMVYDDGTSTTDFTFPPLSNNVSVYNGITFTYDSGIYDLYQAPDGYAEINGTTVSAVNQAGEDAALA